jgi:hypothetical protein
MNVLVVILFIMILFLEIMDWKDIWYLENQLADLENRINALTEDADEHN